jgi:predicted phage terminase large subunit-like protein
MAEYLVGCTTGQITRLVINIPPRYMKSIATSIMWPTWVWGPVERPGTRWLFASYSQRAVTDNSLKRRAILESSWYREHWGHLVRFRRDQNEKRQYQNLRRGEMFSSGMTGTLGKGGDFIVIDDPHDTAQARSRAEREAQIRFFDTTLSTRLNDKFRGVIVLVMQRLGVDDLSGHVLAMGGWEHLKLSGEAHERTVIVFPLSGREVVRDAGTLLWPEREGHEQIAERKLMLGSRDYAGQYDQEPVPLGGAVFRSEWWRYYNEAPASIRRVIISLDGAHKTKQQNDYSVFTIWGVLEMKAFLFYVWRGKAEFPELKRIATALIICWGPEALLVEDASAGSSLIQEFKEPVQIDDRITTLALQFGYKRTLEKQIITPPIVPIQVDRDKLARAEAVTPMVERGDVLLPNPAAYDVPWLPVYLNEFALFTGLNDPHDDQVDSTTQMLNYLRGQRSFTNLMEYYRLSAETMSSNSRNRCVRCNQPVVDNQPYTMDRGYKCHATCPRTPG